MAQARMPNGTRRVFYGATDEEAERQKAEFSNPPTLSTIELGPINTVHDLAKVAWWPRVEASCRPHTVKKYGADYKNHVRPVIGSTTLVDLNMIHCQGVLNQMAKSNLQWKTKDNVRMLMVTLFELAVDLGLLDRNPAKKVSIGKRPPKRQRFMSSEKALEVIAFVKGTPNQSTVSIAMVTGLREAELSNLKWEHLDTNNNVLYVAGQAMKEKGKPLYEAPTKGGEGFRRIYLDQGLIRFIQSVGDQDSPWICGSEGKQTTPDTIYRRWAAIRGKVGLSTWTFHDLRHATLSLLQAIGAQPFTIMSILGHSRIDATMMYESIAADLQREATGDLAKLLGGEPSTADVKPGCQGPKRQRSNRTWRPGEESNLRQTA